MTAPDHTIHFVSLGCAKNRVDTEVMLGVSGESGFRVVDRAEDAQVIVVNTCGFIGPAKEESIDTVLEMAEHKETGRCTKLVVAGCLSQRYATELEREMPEVDHFLGSSDMLKLRPLLEASRLLGRAKSGHANSGRLGNASDLRRMLVGNPADYTMRADDPRQLSTGQHSAFVKIAEGCDRICSFCAIPGIRGGQRSRSIEDLAREVAQLVAQGVVEVNLVSQDTVRYGRDLPASRGSSSGSARPELADLVRTLADIPGLGWLRVHYLYPEKLTAPLLELFADHPKVLPYIDMPLQHASTAVLKRMRRGHGGDRLYKTVERLRSAIPDLVFRTTFLVGHPGETDADFEALCAFVRWAEFDHVGVFSYSHEEGTHAGAMTDLVADDVIAERQRELMELQRGISRARLRARIGTELDVLIDGPSDESEWLLDGRYFGQAPDVDGKVILCSGTGNRGELRKALVTDAADYDLVADLLDAEGTRDAPPGAPDPRAAVDRVNGKLQLPVAR